LRPAPGKGASSLGPLHHRGLWAQVIGGLAVAIVLAAVPLGWHQLTKEPPEMIAAKALTQLSSGVSLGRYQELLGASPAILRPVGRFREAIWVTDLYAVQAILGPVDQVLGYSATTRSARFQPPLERFENHQLGATRFIDVTDQLAGDGDTTLVHSISALRGVWWYSEVIPASGATNEDTIALTSSDASDIDPGLDTGELPIIDAAGLPGGPSEPVAFGPLVSVRIDDPSVSKIRSRLVITTYSVLGPELSLEQLPVEFRFGATRADIESVIPIR